MWIPVCNMFPLKSVTWVWCRAGVVESRCRCGRCRCIDLLWIFSSRMSTRLYISNFQASRSTLAWLLFHAPFFTLMQCCNMHKSRSGKSQAGEWVEKGQICPRQKRYIAMIWNESGFIQRWFEMRSRLNFVGYPWFRSYLIFIPNDRCFMNTCGAATQRRG